MDLIHRLPFMLGALVAIIVSMIGLKSNYASQEIYIRMGIGMVVFYIIGCYVRNTITKLQDEIEKKKKQKELEELEELEMQQAENNQPEGTKINMVAGDNIEMPVTEQSSNDFGEDFSPLKVSQIINTKLEN